MEKFVYYNYLLEIYKSQLTEKNYKIMNDYYAENLSTGEIAEILGVSRSFIGNVIKKTENKLDVLENDLHIFAQQEALRKILELDDIKKIKEQIKEILDN